MIPIDAVEARMATGEPFTYAILSAVNDAYGGDEAHDRLADRTIQKWRRKGRITFVRQDGTCLWSVTE